MRHRTISRTARALVTSVVVALALTAVAFAAAATPKDGTFGGKDISFDVKNGKITSAGGGAGYKCNAIPVFVKKTLAVKKGKFHYSGKVKDVASKPEGKLTLSGKFVSPTKASGKYKLVKGTCKVSKTFTATLGKTA